MNLKNRIKKLESLVLAKTEKTEEKSAVCVHPLPMLKLYRSHPATNFPDRREVSNVHCNSCGYDEKVWSHWELSDEQAEQLFDADFRERQALEVEFINAGLLKYTLFPPTTEFQKHYFGGVIYEHKTQN